MNPDELTDWIIAQYLRPQPVLPPIPSPCLPGFMTRRQAA